MNCNVKFAFEEGFNYFENSTLEVPQGSSSSSYIDLKLGNVNFNYYFLWIPLEYACGVISRLTIKKEIQEQADEWMRANLKSDWVGVHFRGTDRGPNQKYSKGNIKIDTYISYLKQVVDKHCNIFACSDQAQFIDRMNEAFPGRVFSRNIQRSYDQRSLHRDLCYKEPQQRKDALIDLLILSRADLIYKTSGNFSTAAFLFNPSVKIISLVNWNRVYRKYFPENFVRIPEADLPPK